MLNKIWKRNKFNVLLLGISLLFFGVIFIMSPQKLEFDSEQSYNLLTINAVFVGFLYSMLGTMIEFLERKNVSQLDSAGYIDKYYNGVYIGIVCFFLSIIISLGMVFFQIFITNQLILFLEKILTILGVIFFIKSAIGLRKLLSKIRSNNK